MKAEYAAWVVKCKNLKFIDCYGDESTIANAELFNMKKDAKKLCGEPDDKPVKVRVTIEEI